MQPGMSDCDCLFWTDVHQLGRLWGKLSGFGMGFVSVLGNLHALNMVCGLSTADTGI